MPKTRDGIDLPSTLQRSPAKAQRTFTKTLRSAEQEYDSEARARRTAFGALKHSFERVGDHWEPKGKKGPSDAQSSQSGRKARQNPKPSKGGVNANSSKSHLYDLARKLDVPGRSKMSKGQLVDAVQKANNRSTRKARSK